MIVCPNCNHQNPDAAVQCEACYTPLPAMMSCPNCGSGVQSDASFCGQCGSNLKTSVGAGSPAQPSSPGQLDSPDWEVPELISPDPLEAPDPLLSNAPSQSPSEPPAPEQTAPTVAPPATSNLSESGNVTNTKLQTHAARLIHIRTDTPIEIPPHLSVVHIGKPNDRVPPDIDVSGFPDSEVVSRVHADIRIEAGIYYIEDVGSSNGTYINNMALPMGNRHRLRPGDRIALGKGDKVSFLFQLS